MLEGQTDAQLLRRYVGEGAGDAFTALVQRHLSLAYGVARRHCNDAALASEVAQKVFITLAKRAVWLTSHPSLGGWVHQTALNLAQHELRSERRRRQREQVALQLGTCMKEDESLFATIMPVLDEALLDLRAGDREILLLRFFGNKTLRETGAALGITSDTAQKRVAKALDALSEQFRRRGFRVAGAAALGLAMQQASAHAVPVGLAAGTSQAALAAGTAKCFGNLTVPLIKLMSITKLQTAVLCLTVAGIPLGYQWHSVARARQDAQDLNNRLAALRVEVDTNERGGNRAAARVAALKDRLAGNIASHTPANTPPKTPTAYVWDENSPYVRVPKEIMSRVRFAPFATRTNRDGKNEQYQLPPLQADGSPQPALEASLGLSDAETQQLRTLCQTEFQQFQQLVSAHSQVTEGTWGGGNLPTATLNTGAFADDGAQLRDQFQQQLASLLGPDRANAFWEQASPTLSNLFDDFGANPQKLQLIDNPNGLELMTATSTGATIGALSQRNGLPLPPELQAYVSAWTIPSNGQPNGQANVSVQQQ
jgi:RNA polymerase sigma factor (sigma-70 family)